MKYLIFTSFFTITLLASYGQTKDTIITIREPTQDAVLIDMVQLNNNILFQYQDTKNKKIVFYSFDISNERFLSYEFSVDKDFDELFPKKIINVLSDEKIVVLNYGVKNSIGTFITSEVDIRRRTAKTIDSLDIGYSETIRSMLISDISSCSDYKYFYFTQPSRTPNTQGLIKIDQNFNLQLLKQFNGIPDTVIIELQDHIPDMVCLDNNQFLLAGSTHFMSIVDSNLSVLNVIGTQQQEDNHPQGKYYIQYQYLTKNKFNQVVLSGTGSDPENSSLINEHYSAILNVNSDSASYESIIKFSNPDNVSLDLHSSICFNEFNQSIYTAIQMQEPNQGQNIIKYQPQDTDFPKKFYLRKITDNQEAWTRTYGGDANYNIVNLRALDNGYIVIFGHVYNYYGERTTNGFFMIVNEEGELITSNIDIKALDKQVNIYPNPANDWITIDSPEKLTQIRSFDNQGQLLREDIQLQNNQLDISAWPAGIYYLQLFYGGEMVSKRVVKM